VDQEPDTGEEHGEDPEPERHVTADPDPIPPLHHPTG
jgi:hypothetical protein